MNAPNPTPIYRIIHIDNLSICLHRGGLHSSNHTPQDGLAYRTIHNQDIQSQRKTTAIPCGLRGTVHDYVPFYFGALSPMMLQLKTGQVAGYTEGQEPLIYLVSTAQAVEQAGLDFVFSDGHGIASYTAWFDNLTDLNRVDWGMVNQRYWRRTDDDFDRQRRKQAEFLVHQTCPWSLIQEVGVINTTVKERVEAIMQSFPETYHRPVTVRHNWFY